MISIIKKFNLSFIGFLVVALCSFADCSSSSSSDPDNLITFTAPQALNVSISGTLQRSKTLTGSYTYYDLEGDSQGNSTCRWLVSDTADGTFLAIPGAIALDFVLGADEIGKYIKFEITPVALTGTELTGAAVQSPAGGPVLEIQAPYATDVRITGILQDTKTLSGNYVYNDDQTDPEGTSLFQWYIGDSAVGPFNVIAGATLNTYSVQNADVGRFIVFEVTPVASAGATLTGDPVISSACGAIVAVDAPYATNVNITGELAVGATLGGNYTYNDAEGNPQGTSTFKWYRGDTATSASYTQIVGATSIDYVLQDADRGRYIKFEVTPVASAGTTLAGAPVMSEAKGPIKGYAVINVDGGITEADWTAVSQIYFIDDEETEAGGDNNDIGYLYTAWDVDYLYIGISGSFGNGDNTNSVIVYIDTVYNGTTGTKDLGFTGGTYANLNGISGDDKFGYDFVWIGSWGHQNGSDSGLYARDNTTEKTTGVSIVENGTSKDAAEIKIAWSEIGLETPGINRWIAFIPVVSCSNDGSVPITDWYDDTEQAAADPAFTVKITDGTGGLMKVWE